jgi:hypothetical protein
MALDGSAALSTTGLTAAEVQRRLSRSYECQQRRQHSGTAAAAAAAAPPTAIQHGGRIYHLVPLDNGSLELHDEGCVVRGVLQVRTTTDACTRVPADGCCRIIRLHLLPDSPKHSQYAD